MAKKDFDPTNTSSGESHSFDGNLQRDTRDFHVKSNQWTYARNAVNNSNIGDLGKLGNEPANRLCIQVWQNPTANPPTGPFTIIGFIHLEKDKWAVFSTDNTNSEVGYFEEEICRYTRIVNDPCLNFKTSNLIYGQSRKDFECKYNLYWADGLNPDRYLPIGNIDNAPYAQPWPDVPWVCDFQIPTPDPECNIAVTPTSSDPCEICVPRIPLQLDCDKARLESLMQPICIQVSKGAFGGDLRNGSYFALAAYTVNGIRVTDYSTPSNVQALFDHSGVGGALDINIYCIDYEYFDEFELVVVSINQQQAVAKRIGVYNTRKIASSGDSIYIPLDIISNSLQTIPLDQLPIRNSIYDKSEALYEVNDYLLRIAPTSKFMFNYQPLANQISVKWQSVEYPEDYYIKGGNNTGYMRDEVYSFFIRWVYETGDKSASFHIPGRPPFRPLGGNPSLEADSNGNIIYYNNPSAPDINPDVIELGLGYGIDQVPVWQVINTAVSTGPPTQDNILCDGGVVVDEGYMGYWESTERYPDNKPEIWNSSAHGWSCVGSNWPYLTTAAIDYDLCGKNIRHHRFPDNDLNYKVSHFRDKDDPPSPLSQPAVRHIRIMGVKFENIRPPVDNDGNIISNIIGYEILRGSRTGNRSVIAKGIINNMIEYSLNSDGNTDQLGLYQNYPYNDLGDDPFLSNTRTRVKNLAPSSEPKNFNPRNGDKRNLFSFHSPETTFSNPYLGAIELKVYQDLSGTANMRYQYPSDHPKHVILKDFALMYALTAGIALALVAGRGKQSKQRAKDMPMKNELGTLFLGPVGTNAAPHPVAVAAGGPLALVNVATDTADMASQLGSPAGYNLVAALGGLGYVKDGGYFLSDPVSTAQNSTYLIAAYSNAAAFGGEVKEVVRVYEAGAYDYIPVGLNTAVGGASLVGFGTGSIIPTFMYYFTEGAEMTMRAMNAFTKPMQHALQLLSHCLYDNYDPRVNGERRRLIGNQAYIDNQIHNFSERYLINNLYRSKYVALQLSKYDDQLGVLTTDLAPPSVTDNTRQSTHLAGIVEGGRDEKDTYKNPEIGFARTSSTYYAAIKQRLKNQYGQLNSIVQIPISCTIKTCPPSNLGGGRVVMRAAEGFNMRLQNVFACANQVLMDGDFPSASSIGPTPAPWQSDVLNYWTQGTYLGSTVANNGGVQLYQTAPNIAVNTELYQKFFDANGEPLLCRNGQPYKLSYEVLKWPVNNPSEYQLEVYLGAVSPFNKIGTISNITPVPLPPATTTVSSVPYVWDSTVSGAYQNVPISGTINELHFVLKGPYPPTKISAPIPSKSQVPNTGAPDDTRFVLNPKIGIATNNINNVVVSNAEYYWEGVTGNSFPQLYSQLGSYVTNLKCPTKISYNIRFRYKLNGNIIFNPSLAAITNIYMGLYEITSSTPGGSLGALIGSHIFGPSSPTNVNFLSTGVLSGTRTISNPNPASKYALIMYACNYYVILDGDSVEVDLCYEYDDVSITNVCLECVSENAIPGCTDPLAVNYNPQANYNEGCVYVGCCDPNAINYFQLAADPPYGATGVCCEDWSGSEPNTCPCVYINPGGGSGPAPSIGNNGPCFSNCYPALENPTRYSSYTMFGGDIYINRYTEKNTFFYFYDWLYGQPDRTEWDYLKYKMMPWPTYWFNSEGFNVTEFVTSFFGWFTNPLSWVLTSFDDIPFPSEYQVLDRPGNLINNGFAIKYGYMYLFNSGVRDFFVESEYNVDLRDFGDVPEQRHYQSKGRDSYTDLPTMFDTGIIKFGNYYRYDTSLSISRIYYNYTGWGNLYPNYYNPFVAETCYQYRPNRIIYSYPARTINVRDGWRIFLTQNYKDFLSKVTTVKQVNKSGALILFESDSPVMFQGTDQLQTDLGTKLTIGDGGLFSQPMQSLMNADRPYEFGSCQNKLSVINTPAGVFWISQNQGKIFSMMSGLEEISMSNVKWWLAQFLPYQLTKFYPNYRLTDNPVVGIGCQTTYNNTNNIVYFSKKDYKPVLENGIPIAVYDYDGDFFYVGNINNKVQLTDTRYFEKASWTLSYDVKTKSFVSYHDWHPDLTAPGNDTFATTKGNGIWMHNDRCDLYTNYYGINYPFEVEYLTDTVMTVNTLRSVEYQLEVYKYKYENCYDRFHVLDFNFDEAVIYNTEQCSGKLRLNLTPKNNAPLILQYPIINPASIDILYSKEENKYRFNQFWDITRDRGEFDWQVNNNQSPAVPGDLSYPPVPTNAPLGGSAPGTFRQQTIWNTEPNGYVRSLNNFNLNYSVNDKPLQHKKFRHYNTSVLLRRKVSGNKKMLVSITANKNLLSPR